MQNIDLSEIVHVLNVLGVVTSNHLNLSTILCHFLSAKVSLPAWRLKPGFGTQKKKSLSLNRSFPSIELTKKMIKVNIFPGPHFVSPELSSGRLL